MKKTQFKINWYITIIALGLWFYLANNKPSEIFRIPTPMKSYSAEVTGYCKCKHCCGKFADGITASGHKIKLGDKFVAADKNIPFGTMFIIDGYNNNEPVPVLDRGGKITNDCIDVYFDTHQEAKIWGRKKNHLIWLVKR